ncbi:hypothetical protein [Bradyrhizobium acaciae]|nr:hypothetical protein [Bradyrhizobium acaciae]MCC8977931.1 hypothetical protein [Bradyrhizobium acaciae]
MLAIEEADPQMALGLGNVAGANCGARPRRIRLKRSLRFHPSRKDNWD